MVRDIIVIGSPVGGAAALARIVGDLSSDLDASVFVVLHTRPENPILLADVLNDQRGLHAAVALDGEIVRSRRIYVAAENSHLSLEYDRIRLIQNDRNRPPPSIDQLFVSAAKQYAARVIGVLLLHCQEDGIVGLHAIRQAGGRTITHRNQQMNEQPTDPALGQPLSDEHLELANIGKCVLHYAHGGNGQAP